MAMVVPKYSIAQVNQLPLGQAPENRPAGGAALGIIEKIDNDGNHTEDHTGANQVDGLGFHQVFENFFHFGSFCFQHGWIMAEPAEMAMVVP